ncbi:MAG: sugar transferase, partial [Bacillota bacterium]|nr:sugar transferase [Bacillota bacterium]
MDRGIYDIFVKRGLDILLSLAALVILSPLLLLLALLIRAKLGAPVVFRQRRPGLNEKIFLLYKFRSMTEARDGEGNLLPDEERLTRFGRLLRATSLDELPELWNILRGDMSIVGPRPLLPEYLPLYNEEQRRRHRVRPGLTGWAQVNGRNACSWEEKFRLDLWYVEHISFLLDCRIFFMTIGKVLKREGISGEGAATVEPFRGSG